MKANVFMPGQPWKDAAGSHIQAHGGGIIRHDGVWYWYGEDKSSNTSHNRTGVSAYASPDLLNWRHLGVVLPKDNLPPENRDQGAVRLGDIAPTAWSQGYGEYHADRSVVSHDFCTNGKAYKFGIGTHCPGRVVYDLARPYTRITGLAGMNDTSWPDVEVRFRILGDGRELYLSPPVRKNQDPVAFDVSILGVKQLTLEANSTTTTWDGCHADWLHVLLHTN